MMELTEWLFVIAVLDGPVVGIIYFMWRKWKWNVIYVNGISMKDTLDTEMSVDIRTVKNVTYK